MGTFQIICLLSVVTCMIISTVQSVPVSDTSIESENAAKCKKLCGFCGCTGYYCGDECLCECNSANDGDAECVNTMKSNCKKLELPFEVLIQGPNMNRMVRGLLYANPDEEVCVQSSESNLKKRSTISIYKPDELQQNDEIIASPKIEVEPTHFDDSPIIHMIVAQKSNPQVADVEPLKVLTADENIEFEGNMEKSATDDTDSSQQSDNIKLAVADDAVDRTNIKRHIIDVNQDISEYPSLIDDNSFLYKRDAEATVDTAAEGEGEQIGAAAPPAPPAPPAPYLPKFRKVIDSIPTGDEIQSAWESVRNEMNSKINHTIAAAKQRAEDLRAKFASPPQPADKPTPPALTPKFKPFSKLGKEDVGMAPVGLLPLHPISHETQFAKNIAAARAAMLPRQIAKNYQANELIKRWNKDNWMTPWLLGLPVDGIIGSPQDEPEAAADPAPDQGEKVEKTET